MTGDRPVVLVVNGLDFLETEEGAFVRLECNDTPGLSGFPEAARRSLVALATERLRLSGAASTCR